MGQRLGERIINLLGLEYYVKMRMEEVGVFRFLEDDKAVINISEENQGLNEEGQSLIPF